VNVEESDALVGIVNLQMPTRRGWIIRLDADPLRRQTISRSSVLEASGCLAGARGGTDGVVPGERSQTEPTDLNVPLVLSCELIGEGRWSHTTAG
jgi:hypothetical protein